MKRTAIFSIFTLTLAASQIVCAANCDDIHNLASAWQSLAKATHDASAGGYTDAEGKEIYSSIDAGWEATEILADAMIESGVLTEEVLGRNLYAAIDEIDNANSGNLVDAINGMVRAVDNVTTYCNQ